MSNVAGFETHTATFEYEDEAETTAVDDGYGGTVEEPVEQTLEIPVRYEPAGEGFVSEATGEHLRQLPWLYADPLDIGDVDSSTGEWSAPIEPGDEVTLDTIDGAFQIITLHAQSLDSEVPEVVKMEVQRVGD